MTTPLPTFTFPVVSCRVIDGDTLEATVDVGFHTRVTEQFRFARINAPEMDTNAGKVSKEALCGVLAAGQVITIISQKTEKWRRWLAELYIDGKNINDWLVEQGLAEVYQP